jgi:archaellum component FlaC
MNAGTNSLNFEIQNNKIVARLTKEQMNFCVVVRKGDKEMTERYAPPIARPEASTEVKVLELPWKEAPKPGEEYEVLGCAQDSKTEKWGEWSFHKWTAPGKAALVPRIKNPPTSAAAQPPAQDPTVAQAAKANPDPGLYTNAEDEIQARLGTIEEHIDSASARLNGLPNPKMEDLEKYDRMIRKMKAGLADIAHILESIETSNPAGYTEFKTQFDRITYKLGNLEGMLGGIRGLIKNRRHTPAPTPTPVVPPVVDLAPLNGRIGALEQQLKDVNDQLAGKASADDLTALSGRVNGLTDRVTDLDTQVGGLKGEVNGLNTKVSDLDRTCTAGFTSLQGAIAGITTQIANAAAATAAATSTTPPAANTAPAAATAPIVPAANAAPATPANVTPAATPATNGGGKNKKKSRESVNFFALVLGIVIGVLAIIVVFFYATRSQNISAERIGTSDAKSAALAEIENARRLQVEMMDRMHNLQQDVEGYRRQTFVTPSAPAKNNAVTNTTLSTTNVVIVTNTTQVTYSVPSDVSDPRPPMIQRGSYVTGFWSPTMMQDRYGYHRQGFNGYIYPY